MTPPRRRGLRPAECDVAPVQALAAQTPHGTFHSAALPGRTSLPGARGTGGGLALPGRWPVWTASTPKVTPLSRVQGGGVAIAPRSPSCPLQDPSVDGSAAL